MKATANIYGYDASMTKAGDLKGKTYMYIFDKDDPSIVDLCRHKSNMKWSI
jgi:hypothetical protein